jgi:hypothetical protein
VNAETKKPQKALRGWTLLIRRNTFLAIPLLVLAIMAYDAGLVVGGGGSSIVGRGLVLLGLIFLLMVISMAIIAFLRSARDRRWYDKLKEWIFASTVGCGWCLLLFVVLLVIVVVVFAILKWAFSVVL